MTCIRENELLDALGRGYVGEDLAAHAAQCEPCSELHLVATALLDDRAHAIAEAPVPSSGTMWWRMQMRRRQEITMAARRSLLLGQAATLLVAMTLAGVLFGGELVAGVFDIVTALRVGTPMLLGITMWVLALPVAGWLVARKV
jgi:predicted anti-sigma-YlaC factor YlaD